MFAQLSALVRSAPAFPYTLGTQYSTAWGSWAHYEGTAKEGSAAVSIFRISAVSKSDAKLQAARNGIRRLKLVRVWLPGGIGHLDAYRKLEQGSVL